MGGMAEERDFLLGEKLIKRFTVVVFIINLMDRRHPFKENHVVVHVIPNLGKHSILFSVRTYWDAKKHAFVCLCNVPYVPAKSTKWNSAQYSYYPFQRKAGREEHLMGSLIFVDGCYDHIAYLCVLYFDR